MENFVNLKKIKEIEGPVSYGAPVFNNVGNKFWVVVDKNCNKEQVERIAKSVFVKHRKTPAMFGKKREECNEITVFVYLGERDRIMPADYIFEYKL